MDTPEEQQPSEKKRKGMTGWNVFYSSVGPKIQEKMPEENIATMSTVVSLMWKELGEQKKKDWKDKAQRIREENYTNNTTILYTCTCGRKFQRKSLYTFHEKHCGKAVCKDCGLFAESEKALNRHINIIHIKKYECPTCGKCFGDRKDLTRHMDTHSQKKLKCDICGADVSNKSNLTRHKKTQH